MQSRELREGAGGEQVTESQREREREGEREREQGSCLFSVITATEPSGFEDLPLDNGSEMASMFDLS